MNVFAAGNPAAVNGAGLFLAGAQGAGATAEADAAVSTAFRDGTCCWHWLGHCGMPARVSSPLGLNQEATKPCATTSPPLPPTPPAQSGPTTFGTATGSGGSGIVVPAGTLLTSAVQAQLVAQAVQGAAQATSTVSAVGGPSRTTINTQTRAR